MIVLLAMTDCGVCGGVCSWLAAAPMDTDAAGPKPAGEGDKKKRVKKTDVPVATSGVFGLTKKQLDDYFEQEGQMQATDHLQVGTCCMLLSIVTQLHISSSD